MNRFPKFHPFAVLLAALLLAPGAASSAPARAASIRAPVVDDERIFVAVEGDLRGARSLSGSDIKVAAREGVVTLTGSAGTIEQIATAGQIAGRARGVTGVVNHIRIKRPARAAGRT